MFMKCQIQIVLLVLLAISFAASSPPNGESGATRRSRPNYAHTAKVWPQRSLKYGRPLRHFQSRRPTTRTYYRTRERKISQSKSPMGILSRSLHEFANLAVRGLREHARSIKVSDIIQLSPSGRNSAAAQKNNDRGEVDDGPDPHSLPTPEMIQDDGYPVEVHNVVTEDGYILTLHRIPFGRRDYWTGNGTGNGNGKTGSGKRTPVLLQHGVLCSSADWVMQGPDKSLGYILADAGYDVWLGNFRGNIYSRDHSEASKQMDPDKEPFWNFSFDEMGRYDLPAMINHIKDTTSEAKIMYVGHSMGTTTMWIMSDLFPEFAESSIEVMVALAPVATISNMASPVRLIIPFVKQVERAFRMMGQHEFWAQNSPQTKLAHMMCNRYAQKANKGQSNELAKARGKADKDEAATGACDVPENVLFTLVGFNKDQLNATLLPKIMGHTPAGTSLKTLLHYAQILKSDRFQAFDGGPKYNVQRYGRPAPPAYRVSSSRFPVAIFYGENDIIDMPADVVKVAKALPNLIKSKSVPHKDFNHLDFLWAKDADVLLYQDVLEVLNQFRPVDKGAQ